MPSEWMQQKCAGPPIRFLDDGRVEISGEGVPVQPLPKGVLAWKELIYTKAAKYNLPPHLVAGVMAIESMGDPKAESFCCLGLMQLMPSTAVKLNGGKPLTRDQIFEPDRNVDLGCKLLRELWDRYKGNIVNISFGYNAGGAYCGAGCVLSKEKPKHCVKTCSPNRWNLRADCSAATEKTVDYGGRVIAFMNAALKDFPPRAIAPAENPDAATRSYFWPGVLAIGLLAGVAGYAWQMRQPRSRRWTF